VSGSAPAFSGGRALLRGGVLDGVDDRPDLPKVLGAPVALGEIPLDAAPPVRGCRGPRLLRADEVGWARADSSASLLIVVFRNETRLADAAEEVSGRVA
jgi:hypothetical protein